ncbi:MAG: hypothetical protein IPI73_11545 [Betaproteobacteria bacterium]|nr:hypothetical protein [Betaproteobacteria bacterium]
MPAIADRTLPAAPITTDVFRTDAVMSSREHLWQRFGANWGWPAADMTIEQNIVDLGWHQKEFTLRSSFDYAVMSLDGARLLGCVYIDPPRSASTPVWLGRARRPPRGWTELERRGRLAEGRR